MDFAFTEDQESLRELARKILEDRVTHDRLKQIEASADWFDRETWRELTNANLLGVALGEEHGGSGWGFLELCILLAEVGRTVAPVPVYPTLVLGALPIAAFGTAAQKKRFLPRVVGGDCILTAALIEPGSVDPARVSTLANRVGAGFRLEGRKTCVPAVHLAERVIVPATMADGRVGLFLVEPGAKGVTLERQHATSHEPQFRMSLESVEVGEDDLVGGAGASANALAWLLARATAGLCALELGVAERSLRITADYAAKREQFNQPIGAFQAVHQRAADAFIDVECIRWTMWRAASRLADGADASDDVSIAKFWASEGGHRVTYAAQHLHGGIGVDVDYPIHRYYLWSRQIEVMLGTGKQHLAQIGESIAQGR
jgi:hypothetical protein